MTVVCLIRKRGHGLAQFGVNEARGYLSEWHEYEGALGNPWVRDIQLSGVERPASIEEDVDIHSAGPVP